MKFGGGGYQQWPLEIQEDYWILKFMNFHLLPFPANISTILQRCCYLDTLSGKKNRA